MEGIFCTMFDDEVLVRDICKSLGVYVLKKLAITQSWGIGLTQEEAALLRAPLGEEHELLLVPQDAIHRMEDDDLSPPCVLWLSSSCREALTRLPEAVLHCLEDTPKIMLLREGYTLEDFEFACDYGFEEVLRPPVAKERVADIMRRALEARLLHQDIECMTREILLDREILERKNEILDFLVNFLTHFADCQRTEHLLQKAYDGLRKLLPVRALHAALWEKNASAQQSSVDLFLNTADTGKEQERWREALLAHVEKALGSDFTIESSQHITLPGQTPKWREAGPDEGALLCLPLVCGTEQLGILLLRTAVGRHLGRDQVLALDSAMRHFSLSLKNIRRLLAMQRHADYDALTNVHSRRHFDCRLQEETQRFIRYEEPLSIIMLDIDHFKQVNDTRGHHVGDIVLREVAALMMDSIRNTDYCARYGGEEFVILLPHTGDKKAFALAERIRKRIARHTFVIEDESPLQLTVSLGVASLPKENADDKLSLLCDADAAMYLAKQAGRNRTRRLSRQASKNSIAVAS